jgi:hypothetical protein
MKIKLLFVVLCLALSMRALADPPGFPDMNFTDCAGLLTACNSYCRSFGPPAPSCTQNCRALG